VLIFALAGVAPLVLGAFISLVLSVWIAKTTDRAIQQNMARSIGTLLDKAWQSSIAQLHWGAMALGQAGTDQGQRTAVFQRLQRNCAICQAFWLIDSNGSAVQDSGSGLPTPRLSDTARAMLGRGETSISTDQSAQTGTSAVILAMPVRFGTDRPGALVVQLDVQKLGEPILEAVQPLAEGYGYIIDDRGRLLISPHAERVLPGRDVSNIALVKASLQGRQRALTNYTYVGLMSRPVDGVWYRIPSTGWYVLVEAPPAITRANNWYLVLTQVALIMLAGLVAILLGRRLAATITHPIEQLQQGVVRLQAGSWNDPVAVQSRDELGQLADAFNAMAQELQEKQATLIARREELGLVNDELQQALQAAQAANQLKAQFVATVSHELRTPLTSVLGYTDMLRLGVYGHLTDSLRDAITQINDSSEHLLRLINDLLDFAKIEAGQQVLHEECLALADLIAEVIRTCTPQAQAKNLTLRTEIDRTLPTMLYSDQLRLRQILLNLVSNAVKFTDQGGITLRATRAVASGTGKTWEPASLVIEVEDTGIGIAPEDQDMIFEEFRQVDKTFSSSRAGTGLGLAISRHLVTLMGGTVTVVSQIGRGSIFTITLPLNPAPDNTVEVDISSDHDSRV
jgi:signal transduction histidine kinase